MHLHRVWGEHAVGSCVIRMSLGWNLVIVYYHLNFFLDLSIGVYVYALKDALWSLLGAFRIIFGSLEHLGCV